MSAPTPESPLPRGYPIFLVGLDRRRCVVIGGDAEAERKVTGLLDCGAQVVVVAPTATSQIDAWAARRAISWHRRGPVMADLDEAWLVIVTHADAAELNWIQRETEARRILLNVLDDLPRCSFIAGSVLRRGPLTVAISTNGAAPVLAVRLRQKLEREVSAAHGDFLAAAAALRPHVYAAVPDKAARKRLWYALVDSPALELFEAGRAAEAAHVMHDIIAATRHDLAAQGHVAPAAGADSNAR